MADERQFKFVSPGIFVTEIDNSQLPGPPTEIGPVIIGRLQKGPALRPVTVNSFAEFVETFGAPVPGKQGGDIWRNGNTLGPTYAAYAAQAWLRNTPGATIVRVLGRSHDDATKTTTPANAGWHIGDDSQDATDAHDGGAYGLFLMPSGAANASITGALAAIVYCKEGAVGLAGTTKDGASVAAGARLNGEMFVSSGAHHKFNLVITDTDGTTVENVDVDFNPDGDLYIRDRLNTNPTLLNTTVTATANKKTYVLGQTYDRAVMDVVGGAASGKTFGFVLAIRPAATDSIATQHDGGHNLRSMQPSRSGWVISQDISTNTAGYAASGMQKLFRLEGLDNGEWCQNNIKITIEDVKYSENPTDPYGTFSLAVRQIDDNDNSRKNIERFGNLNLNPNSENYIGKRIGNQYHYWEESERRYKVKGDYPNQSRYVRIQMNASVDDGATDPALLPFGFFSNPRLRGQAFAGDDTVAQKWAAVGTDAVATGLWMAPAGVHNSDGTLVDGMDDAANVHIVWPAMPMRSNSSDSSLSDPSIACFGFDPTRKVQELATSATLKSSKVFDASVKDVARCFTSDGTDPIYSYAPNGVDGDAEAEIPARTSGPLGSHQNIPEITEILAAANNATVDGGAGAQYDTTDVFSLDDLKDSGTSHALWSQGSRRAGSSKTAVAASYKEVLDDGFDKFTLCMFGGFDGLDITEQEPLRNSSGASNGSRASAAPLNGATELTSYAFNSVKMAIDSCADPDVVQALAVCAPGITNADLTTHAIETAEARGDMIAVIDLENDYVPATESTTSSRGAVSGSSGAVTALQDRNLNNSYGCAYYPWIQIQDTVNGATLWAPPSIAALGVFSSTDRNEELWFAPAGFTRGGLSANEAAGLPVVGVRQRLTEEERDRLYANNINPIAHFATEGIVVFGQKTLQVTRSALDRVNVRRLMIYLKREISKIAATTLFDQNVQATWARFKGPAENLLASVKSRYGLSAYKLKLDETTTTPDLIDRNIMYAKIFLAPTKAIEFIALDFVITRTGASFED